MMQAAGMIIPLNNALPARGPDSYGKPIAIREYEQRDQRHVETVPEQLDEIAFDRAPTNPFREVPSV